MSKPAFTGTVTILGIFAADLSFRAERLPKIGETLLSKGFALGRGGKGSNQAAAAARSGARVRLITRVGADTFGAMAREMLSTEGIDTTCVTVDKDAPTGAAFIIVDESTGDNAIIVESGAAGRLGPSDLDQAQDAIIGADVFMTQLEQPVGAAERGFQLARSSGLLTVLNPAPAARIPEFMWPLCDYVTPNESEASAITGITVTDLDSARHAGDRFLSLGVGCAILTRGDNGVLVHSAQMSTPIPALAAGAVVDTTGAGEMPSMVGLRPRLLAARQFWKRRDLGAPLLVFPSRGLARRPQCRPVPRRRHFLARVAKSIASRWGVIRRIASFSVPVILARDQAMGVPWVRVSRSAKVESIRCLHELAPGGS
jgi:ribokinase